MKRLFPGDRAVWVVAGLVWLVGGAFLLHHLLRNQEHLTGTNTASPTSRLAEILNGQELCQDGVPLPDGTGRVRIHVFASVPEAPVTVTLTAPGRRSTGRMALPHGLSDALVPIEPVWRVDGDALLGRVCVKAPKAAMALHGQGQRYPGDGPLTFEGQTLQARLSLWFHPPAGDETSLASLSGKMMERAALFRPSPIGAWTYWVLLLIVAPLGIYVGIRAIATGTGGRRALIVVGAVAVANAGTWALLTPPFDAPDEQAHFAYVEQLARTGHAPERGSGVRPPLSTQTSNALNGSKTFGFYIYDTRPPWTELDEQRWQAETRGGAGLSASDGGGVTTATTHGPLYYGVLAPAYLLASADGTFSELTLTRLLSALLAGLIAICAALVVRELLPRWPSLSVAAGLLVAFLPTFGFISGAINNDTGVNAVAALTVLLLIRALRRGFGWRSALALGVLTVALPAAKGTGYELYPVIAATCAVLGVRWFRRGHDLREAVPAAVLVGTFLVAYFGWSAITGALASTGGAGALGGHDPLDAGTHSMKLFLSYLWQTFLPALPFMSEVHPPGWPFYEVYVKQGWAVFGWTNVIFPAWVYDVILAVTAVVGVAGLVALGKYRDRIVPRLPELGLLLLVPLSVVAGVAYAVATPTPRPAFFEQGRYVFPALVALAALVCGACTLAGRRWAGVVATGLVACTSVIAMASFALAMSAWYS